MTGMIQIFCSSLKYKLYKNQRVNSSEFLLFYIQKAKINHVYMNLPSNMHE